MEKKDAITYMRLVKKSKARWAEEITKFNHDTEQVLKRLIHEAVRHYMSAEQVAAETGLTAKRVRALMRQFGLNPKSGKRLLADNAAKALESNAELMGIKPWQMDLTSPLAYLPMGDKMKARLDEEGRSRVHSLDGVTPEMVEAFKAAWAKADEDGLAEHRVEAGLAAALAVSGNAA